MKSGEIAFGDMEDIRKKYLSREASLQIIGGLWVLLGVLMIFWGTICIPFNLPGPDPLFAMGGLFLFILVGTFNLWIGLSLGNLRNWARITLGLINIPGLIVYPMGTVLCGLFLYLLFSRKAKFICSQQYHEVIEGTLHIKYPEMFFVGKIIFGVLFLILSVAIYPLIIGKGGR